MAFEDVMKEILADANEKVKSIQDSAREEIAKIDSDAEAKISEMKVNEDKRLKSEIELLRRQEISSAELESKNMVLAKKKEILSRAFSEALAEMEGAPKKDKLDRYKKLIKDSKKLIAKPIAVISDKDGFSAEELGVEAVETDKKIRAGLILRSKDGTVEVDLQYRTLLEGIWSRELKALSDILFG